MLLCAQITRTPILVAVEDLANNVWRKLDAELERKIIGIGCEAHIIHNCLQCAVDWDPVHNPEKHVPNGHDPEWTQSRMDTIPNGRNPEWTPSRMDTIPNGHNPEWTQSRKYTIPIPFTKTRI